MRVAITTIMLYCFVGNCQTIQIEKLYKKPNTDSIFKIVIYPEGDTTWTFYYLSELATKQPTLISGTNIKTVNGLSLLGSGDITISGSADITGKLNISDTAAALAGYSRNTHTHTFASLTSKPNTLSGYGITDAAGNGNGAITNAMLANGAVANLSGTNTGDNATNTQYSGLAASKQDLLVSNTNIKTVGGQTLLGSGNIVTTNSQTFVPLAANFSSTSTTPAAVTGWSFAVTSGITYRVQVIGAYQTAATTTGGIIGISLTGATGTVRGSARGSVVSTAAATELAIGIVATSGTGSTLTTTGVTAINSPHHISMDITFTCTGTGTFNIVWGTEVNASAAQINQNSSLIYQALN